MKTLGNIIYTLIIVALLSVAGLFVASLLPIPGHIEIKIVQSGSMEPTIPTGSVIVIRPTPPYRVGDIVTFGEDTGSQIPTTHRIVAVEKTPTGERFVTKGDANEEADTGYTNANTVIGRVIFSIPGIGYILDFAKKPLGFALLIGIPALMIVIDEAFKIVAELRARPPIENV